MYPGFLHSGDVASKLTLFQAGPVLLINHLKRRSSSGKDFIFYRYEVS